MTIQPVLCPLSVQTLFDQNGCPVRGGKITVYDAETTDLRTIYADEAMTTELPNPTRTSGFGRIPKIWVGTGAYKVVLQDQFGSQIETVDDLPGGVDVEPTPTLTSGWNTGDMKFAHTDDTQDGWTFANGLTIGSAESDATGRANDDCQALYTKLWNKDSSLVVTPSRGLTAAQDWAAAKVLALPDYRGRGPVGVDAMGAPITAGVLTAASTPTPDKLGTQLGNEAATLTVDELPTFTPQITVANAGGFTPAGTIASAGAHIHTGTTTVNGDHNHTIPFATVGGGGGGNAIIFGGNVTPTSNSGSHSHSLNVDSGGAHTHAFAGTAQPDHTHAATAQAIGSGNSHGNIQPSILGYWLIKL